MAAFKTHNFLPEIFQTDTNKKFLNATLDQLISEPNFKRVNGYIGRQFAPTYKSADSYVEEIDSQRQNYQLEPSVIVRDPEADKINFYAGYADVINKIKHYGGNVDNHSRLFSSDTYSYDGHFDFDKFVNFSQYYWLPNGTEPLAVSATGVPLYQTFAVNLNTESNSYYFGEDRTNTNREITLAYGGVYEFDLDGLSGSFNIQIEPSETGFSLTRPNIDVRQVLGVENNGATTGTVRFKVPQPEAQRRFTSMTKIADVDYATSIAYRDIQGNTIDEITRLYGGLDGRTDVLDGKKIVFVSNTNIDDYHWTAALVDDSIVPAGDRTKTWVVQIVGGVINLTSADTVNKEEKIYVKAGQSRGTKSFYVNYLNWYTEVPLLTAGLTKLYYQNGDTGSAVGVINLVKVDNQTLDPAADIVGKVNFTSANQVSFTNGLKVRFDSSATAAYANKTYWVEGVGTSIRLIPFEDTIAVEQWSNSQVIVSGTLYQVDDVVTIAGGEYERPARLLVTSVNTRGGITGFEIIDQGDYSVLPTNPVSAANPSGIVNVQASNYNQTTDPENSFIKLDGTKLSYSPGRGHTIAVINPATLEVESIDTYDTYLSGSNILTSVLTAVDDGKLIAISSFDATAFNQSTRSYVNSIFGLTNTDTWTASRVAHIIVGIKNSNITGYESISTTEIINSGDIKTSNVATFDLYLQPTTADYITINRGALNKNPWSRANRWVHASVIQQVAEALDQDYLLDQNAVARRPIIEFDADLALFGYGKVGLSPVNVFDTIITNAYSEAESQSATNPDVVTLTVTTAATNIRAGEQYVIATVGTTDFTLIGAESNTVGTSFTALRAGTGNGTATQSVTLHNGDRVVFSRDENPNIRSQIYSFSIVNVSDDPEVPVYTTVIEESGDNLEVGHNILVKTGILVGKEYYYTGTEWVLAQAKTSINQNPLFDVFDENGISFGDTSVYPVTTFVGTKIFSYTVGTGTNDAYLGFPLSYRTFQNVGDIQFTNNYDTDTFTYLISPTTETKNVNTGVLYTITGLTTYNKTNMWRLVNEKSKQYQLITHSADGVNNLFEIDILPNPSINVPNLKVILNGEYLGLNDFGLSQIGARYAVLINPELLTAGDSIDILIYSDSVSTMGYYQVPNNLDNNAENTNFTVMTLGQLRNHLVSLSQNSLSISGSVPGSSNLRDINIKDYCGNILKHSSPAIYSELFLIDETLNFVNGLRLAQKEYSKFKNRFLEIAGQIEVDVNNISGTVDTILTQINGIKNINFPWYYSDMVPWGENKHILPTYTVLDLRIKSYELTSIFDDTTLSNRAILIYHSRTDSGVTTTTLLAKDRDYTFSSAGPSFTISDNFGLLYGDQLTVVEYSSTDGNFVPETPTKLGLWPKFVPEKYQDNTYVSPVDVIQGHDGSITPAFGDYRDDLLLELELRIYNNIKIDFKFDDLINNLPGKFRVTDYSLKEFNQIISTNFLAWVGNNRLDFSTNQYFKSNDPWTWNYKKFKDSLTGELLPGTWRAAYKYFYDTDRPHTHPWEMLGFSEEPSWWRDRYGPAPYTGGNMVLWSDLSLGFIYDGPRVGIDKRYARPGLLQIIPVDESGNLRSPESFLVLDYDSNKANTSYAVGDQGPIETAWRRSSDYPYAVQLAMALMKPAEYFGKFIDVSRYEYNSSLRQYLINTTNSHLEPIFVQINGDTSSGTVVREAGYINWVAEYLKQLGISDPATKIKNYLNYLTVQLSYKVSGFTDQNYLSILAEQGSPNSQNNGVVIPDENYSIVLNKSVPVNKIAYSAVIVEKSAAGFTVSGYNLNNPYFTIVPSLANNNSYAITAGNLRGVIYKDYQKVRVRVPYGQEFTSTQQVVDFLVSYQRYLQSQGFVFTDYIDSLRAKQDWILSAREFLSWSQQGWKEGSVIVLSPVYQSLRVSSTNSVVDEITNTPYGSKVLDPNFAVIKNSSFTVSRDTNRFSLKTINGQTIAYAEFNLVQYEHVIIFDNKTVFNDVIYAPETGNRQYRLKLIGYKTAEWTGALNPPGFIYNSPTVEDWVSGKDYRKGQLVSYKNFYYTAIVNVTGSDTFNTSEWKQISTDQIKTGLLPNYAFSAQLFENIYDLDNPSPSEKLDFYSTGITGFRERSYLTDLSLDLTTQSKFYQGYIKQKGTKNAILALASAQLANINNEVEVFEEWALRVGEYGATDSNQYVEVILDEATVTANPAAIQFVDTYETPESGAVYFRPNDWYRSSTNNVTRMFEANQSSSDKVGLPTAGYVNIDDIDVVVFDLADYRNLGNNLSSIGTGYKIWTAKDFFGQWNVFRVSETNITLVSIAYNLDSIATFSFGAEHSFQTADILAVKGFDALYDGFYQVYEVVNAVQVNVVLMTGVDQLRTSQYVYGTGSVFKLTSVKISTQSELESITPTGGWDNGDRVWVDNLDSDGNWGVYTKTSPWSYQQTVVQDDSSYSGNDSFGHSVSLSADRRFLYAGAPNNGSGRATIFIKQTDGTWVVKNTFTSTSYGVDGFGSVVNENTQGLIVSAPDSASSRGYVFVYNIVGTVFVNQVIVAPSGAANYNFGKSVSSSADGKWLYVGEPGRGIVYTYALTRRSPIVQTLSAGSQIYGLSESVEYASDICVTDQYAVPLIPEIQYTVSGTTIIFNAPLTSEVRVTFPVYYYKLIGGGLIDPGGSGNNFGTSVKTNTDGSILIVGSSTRDANGVTDNGSVYIYERTIEKFVGTGSQNTFIPVRALGSTYRVTVDGIEQSTSKYYVSGGNIVFYSSYIPAVGTKVGIENNYFVLIQELTGSMSATQIVEGQYYTIASPGDSDFIGIGASSNAVGVTFKATSVGTGTGKVYRGYGATSGQNLGTAVDICSNSCSVYAGAPGYKTQEYNSGEVIRYVNQGKIYGTITGKVQNPVLPDLNQTLRINGIEVAFNTGTSLSSVVGKINGSNITGITAAAVDGYLTITSTIVSDLNKLDILPGKGSTVYNGSALSALGLEIFAYAQTLRHPSNDGIEQFGYTLKVNSNATQIAIGSQGASATEVTTFDSNTTEFDSGSVDFKDEIAESGAVYIYDLLDNPFADVDNPAMLAYVQELSAPALSADSNFGVSFEFVDDYLYTGASGTDSVVDGGGSIYEFVNSTGTQGWELTRYRSEQVDIASISKIYIYNKKTNIILAKLDIYDPVKGKVLGIADQDIDFKTIYDPASYNYSAATDDQLADVNVNFHWGAHQVGKTWWDTSKISFVEYEQGSLVYKNRTWGSVVPGSLFVVYEWVESDYLPSDYIANGGNGNPKDILNGQYTQETYVDPATNAIKVKYYYWVSDKTTVDINATNRTNSVYTIQQILANPMDQGIPYAAAIAPNALSLFNVTPYLTSDEVVLHIDHSPIQSTNIIHSEYELVKEGAGSGIIPDRIINKLQDSLAGVDASSLAVPDPALKESERYGISIRPRQTMVADKSAALENFVKYVNSVFKLYPIADRFSLDNLNYGEPLPVTGTGEWDQTVGTYDELLYLINIADGYRVAVLNDSNNDGLWVIYEYSTDTDSWTVYRIQSFLTSLFYNRIDWYDSTFDYTEKPTYTVENYVDTKTLTLVEGDTVKINNNGDNRFAFYRVNSSGTLDRVGSEAGTIEISDSVYSTTSGLGFDDSNFESVRFDQSPVTEIRYIYQAITEDFLINDLAVEFNKLFFSMVNYIFSENTNPDWIFKTSFVSVLHKIRDLEQYPSYIKDNQTFYESYINEVKPYKTTIREYVPKQNGIDYLHAGATDFDKPGYYDSTTGTYRSPTGGYTTDANLLVSDDYIDWSNNYKYKVTNLEVANAGTGYTLIPNVSINGGGGSGATAQLFVSNGSITGARIVTAGSGYTSTPTVTVNGNGTGAVLVPVLRNEYFKSNTAQSYNTVRSITTEIKFDRVDFTSDVVQWTANTPYVTSLSSGVGSGNIWIVTGNLVSYNNEVYLPKNANTYFQPSFDAGLYEKLDAGNALIRTNNRIQGYYEPGVGMPDANVAMLINGIEYPGVKVQGNRYDAYTSVTNCGAIIAFFATNSSIVSTNTTSVNFLNLGYEAGQQLYVFGSTSNDSAFRIVSVTASTMVLGYNTVVTESAGASVTLKYLTDNDLGNYDAAISSTYLDTQLGTRPEDINIDGGAYVDTYNSFGPEEFVPGRMYDALEMRVFTASTSSIDKNNYYIGRVVLGNVGYGYSEGDVSITVNGMSGAVLTPVLAANGAITSINIDSSGTGLTGNGNPTITITGANVLPASANVYITQTAYSTIGYRYFVNMNQANVAYRISGENTTTLSADLDITDSNVYVTDASVLMNPNPSSGIPGIVFINGEKIHYYERDTANNRLGRIRRAVDGTGAPSVHTSGTKVSDSSITQQFDMIRSTVPGSPKGTLLTLGSGTAVNGAGLYASTTVEAGFLRDKASYTP